MFRGVLGGRTRDLQVAGKTLKLTAQEAGELDVVIRMRQILNNRRVSGHELMSEAQFQERLRLLAQVNLKRHNLTESELQDIVNGFASRNEPFLKPPE
jgi:hypothetical protein